jgi:hypothetical protein
MPISFGEKCGLLPFSVGHEGFEIALCFFVLHTGIHDPQDFTIDEADREKNANGGNLSLQ